MSMVPSFKNLSFSFNFSFNFSFYFKIFVIVVGEKWVPCPICVGEKWLPIQNSAVRSGYLTKTWLSEVVTWPKLVGETWSPDQWTGYHILPTNIGQVTNMTSFGQVTTSDSQFLVGCPLLTAEFWIGNYFSPTRIGQGTHSSHSSQTTINRILKKS